MTNTSPRNITLVLLTVNLVIFKHKKEWLLLVNSLAIMHYWWLEKWDRFLQRLSNFCWWCEVLSTEMRSFFGEPKVNQKNSSFQCEALHRTSKSWSGAVKIWRTLKGTMDNALLSQTFNQYEVFLVKSKNFTTDQ